MDAKDRLRRYLEQRRELGESEFVLDAMPVEDVLRLVGMRGGSGAARPESRGDAHAQAQAHARTEATTSRADTPTRRSGNAESIEPAPPAPPVEPPPAPSVRFSGEASTDWRATLQANAPPPTPMAMPSATPSAMRIPAPIANPAASPNSPASGSDWPAWLTALGIPAGLDAGKLHVVELLPDVASCASLDDVAAHVAACTRCALHKTARHPVPGEGNPQAEVLCVGEAPGANEDEQGRPFVGDAGQLLNKILGAIQLEREDVFICNVLKHRPPGNRDPLPDEVAACQPYLLRQIELVRPKVIIAWGRFAAQTLLQTTTGIGQLRGHLHRYHGVPLIVTYHPAALLRNEAWKRPTWEDVKLARRVLDASRDASITDASSTDSSRTDSSRTDSR